MKQTLLKSLLFLCSLIVGSVAWAEDVTYDFTAIEGFSDWSASYGKHVVEYSAATVTFESANRQTTTITNQPVTKGQPVTLVMTGTKTISAVSFKCTQWGSKAQTITLHYSKDGGKNYTSTDVTSTTFAISSSNLPTGTNAVKITFSSTSNQIGIASATITYEDGSSSKADPKLSFSSETAEATFGQDFTAPTLNTATGFNGTVEYSSSVETVAQVMDPETGELRIVGGGTTVITATFAGNDDFNASSASYTLTVKDNRVATTITQEDITLDVADVATLTQLAPVVKDAEGNIVSYTNDPNGEGMPEVYFELVGEDKDGIIGSIDSHGNIILNSVAGTVTVKAVYNHFQMNPDYRPSECTFTITVYQPLNGIAEFCKLTNNTSGTLKLTDAVVVYVNGKDMFVRDATGAVDFYNTGLTYEAGNVLNGKITAKYTLYNNMNELTTQISDNTLVATAGDVVEPIEITSDNAADYACNLVKFTGVKVTKGSDGKFYVDNVQVYDKFKLKYALEDGKTYDIVGIMIPYNTIYEICPTEAPKEIAAETVTVGEAGYATYVAKNDVSFPNGVKAFIGAVNGNTLTLTQVNAVPKGTPVVLMGEGTYELSPADGIELDDVSANELKASVEPVEANGTQYVLAKVNDVVGFYKATGTIPAGKAYLEVNAPTVKAFFFNGEEETSIVSPLGETEEGVAIYNLAGQRISKLQKGINIVGGKKVLK
ncbi:MAG: hypothetical protein J5524_01310 [Bacteroidaceae bacterium]|nr:hypothetical protein [Bacteroidaceae bacterium]